MTAQPIPTTLELCTRHSALATLCGVGERFPCPSCAHKFSNYCGACCRPTLPPSRAPPVVRLPLRVEILRGKEETDSKSTAAMVATCSPDVRIWKLPAFPTFADPRRVALLYPSPQSVPVTTLDARDFDALLVIDTTWSRAGGVLQTPQLAAPFVHVHLQGEFPRGGPHTIFWRHQPLGPACLSTAEALYFALRGLEVGRRRRELAGAAAAAGGGGGGGGGVADAGAAAAEGAPGAAAELASSGGLYDGRFDDLLLFFMATYHRVQHEYTAGSRAGEAYTRKQRPGYIRGAADAEQEGGGGGGGGGGGRAAPVQQLRRKRQRLKGGWALRQDALAPQAALLKSSTETRFAHSNLPRAAARPEEVEGKEEGVYFALVREQQHEYAQKKKAKGSGGAAPTEGGGAAAAAAPPCERP
jgi:hypothetical protein